MSIHYIYLHGLASSPHSTKAQYFRDNFSQNKINLSIPDLNQSDFFNLTLSRQLQQVSLEFPNNETPVMLIGSSFGGLTAAWLGENYPQIQRLILLAPAFGFLAYWLETLGETEVKQWETTGEKLVYHYGEKQSLPLSYQFILDGQKYNEQTLKRPIPTLIFHGKYDEIVPIEYSRDYAKTRPWVNLIELDSDHGLTDVLSEIWRHIQQLDFLSYP